MRRALLGRGCGCDWNLATTTDRVLDVDLDREPDRDLDLDAEVASELASDLATDLDADPDRDRESLLGSDLVLVLDPALDPDLDSDHDLAPRAKRLDRHSTSLSLFSSCLSFSLDHCATAPAMTTIDCFPVDRTTSNGIPCRSSSARYVHTSANSVAPCF